MNLDLTGKTAVVCGSTQGIGKAIATELAGLGASVVLVARKKETLEQCLAELPGGAERQHAYIQADFDRPEQVKEAIESYVAGGGKAHILINNSGGPAAGTALGAGIDDYLLAFNRHLVCNQILAQTLVPSMKEAGYGRIVNIISTSVKQPLKGLGVSNTVRGAVASWAKTLAEELGPFGVTVNNVLPGATKTGRLESIISNKSLKGGVEKGHVEAEMLSEVPAGRFAEAWEIAAAAAFLCSPSASYINGINLPVDGGRTLCL